MLLSGADRGALPRGRAVVVLALAETVAWGVLYYGFGILLGPSATRLHVTESAVAPAFSLALLASAVSAPLVGRAVDHFDARRVMTLGSLLGAVGFAALARSDSLPTLYAAWAVLGFAHAGTSYEPAFAAVTSWFPDLVARRRALLVVTSVAGFASTVFVPLISTRIALRGPSRATLELAGLLAFVVAPMFVVLPGRGVEAPAVAPTSPAASRPELGRLAGALALHALASTAVAVFLFGHLSAEGSTPTEAAQLVGLVGAAQVPARVFYEPLCRVTGARSRMPALLLAQGVCLFALATTSGLPRITAALVFGATNGLTTLERATVVAAWFGRARYATVAGQLAASSSLARAASPLLVAALARDGTYTTAFASLAFGLGLAAWLVRAERPPWSGRRTCANEEVEVTKLRPTRPQAP